jgi:hypothetical protein
LPPLPPLRGPSAHILGSRGRGTLGSLTVGPDEWVYQGRDVVPVQAEHDALFAAIPSGQPLNNGEYVARRTLLAIMGRMAAYTGQQITWEMALNSREDLSPPRYAWDVKLPMPPVARPGQTRLV